MPNGLEPKISIVWIIILLIIYIASHIIFYKYTQQCQDIDEQMYLQKMLKWYPAVWVVGILLYLYFG